MIYPITRFTILPLLRPFVSSIRGWERLPKKPPFIIASNHISQSDALLIIATLFKKYHQKIHFIANRGGYGEWVAKHIATNWAGCILINPKNPNPACLDIALNWLLKGKLVGLFPEAERVPEGTWLRQGKTGAARLAIRSGLPVLPLGLITKGERHLKDAEGYKVSKPRDALKDYLFKGGRTQMIIGKPLSFSQYTASDITRELLRQVTDQIMLEISRLTSIPYSSSHAEYKPFNNN